MTSIPEESPTSDLGGAGFLRLALVELKQITTTSSESERRVARSHARPECSEGACSSTRRASTGRTCEIARAEKLAADGVVICLGKSRPRLARML